MVSERNARDSVVLAIATCALFVRLVMLLRKACQVNWQTEWCEICASMAKFWRQVSPDPGGQLGGLVRGKMDEWEVQHVSKAITFISWSLAFISLLHVTNIIMGSPRKQNMAHDILFYTVYVSFLLLERWSWLITPRSIDWVYFSFLAVSIVWTAVGPAEMLLGTGGLVKLLVACLSICRLQVVKIAVSTSLVAIAESVCLYFGRPGMDPTMIRGIIVLDGASVLVLVAFVWILRQSVQANFFNYFEARALQSEQSAFKRLLSMVCDVVIELDSQLCVVGPAQELGTLLRSSSRAMEGIPFIDLVQKEEDKAHLHELCTSRCATHAMHVTMRDGNGTFIEVEIFSFQFEGLDGTARYLAGLREFSDKSAASEQLPGWTTEAACIAAPQAIIVDTFDQLRILKVSNGLECLTAAAQGKHFVKYVENCSDFTAWIQRHMNVRMNAAMDSETCSDSVSEESFAPTSFEIKLRPRSHWNHSHFSAVCTLQSADSNDIFDDTDLELHHTRIRICNMVRRPGGFRNHSMQSHLPHNTPWSRHTGCFKNSTEGDDSGSSQNETAEAVAVHARQMSL